MDAVRNGCKGICVSGECWGGVRQKIRRKKGDRMYECVALK